MTLTTEQLRARAKFWREKAVEAKWESVSIAQDMLQNADAFDELAANREAQPVAWRYRYRRGPHKGTWIYVANESECATRPFHEKQELYTAPPAPAVPEEISSSIRHLKDTLVACNRFNYCADAVNRVEDACRAAMLAQPVSQHYMLPEGWIACSERLPEPNKYVQVSNGVWVGIGMYNDAEHFEDDERWQDEHREFIDLLHHPVTHWMPLPAAPGGGK